MSCVRGCCETQADHWRSINATKLLASANKADNKLDRDRDAYRRFRGQGLQPKGIDDCSILERTAETRLEVERGHLFPTKQMQKEALEIEQRGREAEETLIKAGVLKKGDHKGVRNEWK